MKKVSRRWSLKGSGAYEYQHYAGLLLLKFLVLAAPSAFSQDATAAFIAYASTGGEYRAGKEPRTQSSARGHESCLRGRERGPFCSPAAHHLVRNGSSGNDSVYVFGSKLRQQRFTAGDFTLNALNTADAVRQLRDAPWGHLEAVRFVREVAAVNRAESMKEAAGHQLDRTDQEIIFHVMDSYYGVLLARKQLEVAEQSMKTAQAILDRSKDRFESGVVVESDYLSAQVRLATRKQEMIRAQNNLALARAQLSTSMGISAETEFDPAEALARKASPRRRLMN